MHLGHRIGRFVYRICLGGLFCTPNVRDGFTIIRNLGDACTEYIHPTFIEWPLLYTDIQFVINSVHLHRFVVLLCTVNLFCFSLSFGGERIEVAAGFTVSFSFNFFWQSIHTNSVLLLLLVYLFVCYQIFWMCNIII